MDAGLFECLCDTAYMLCLISGLILHTQGLGSAAVQQPRAPTYTTLASKRFYAIQPSLSSDCLGRGPPIIMVRLVLTQSE